MHNQKTVSISENVHRRMKSEAALKGMSLSELVDEMLTKSLDATDHQTETNATADRVSVAGDVQAQPGRVLYTDAGTQDNGGVNQVSRICVHDGTSVVFEEVIGNYTINQAEMMAIAKAIEFTNMLPTTIYSDSQLAVNLITGAWKGKEPNLKQLADTIHLPSFIELKWVPRENNPAGWYLEQTYTKRTSLSTPNQSKTKPKKGVKRNRWQIIEKKPKPKASTLSAKELIERLYGTH